MSRPDMNSNNSAELMYVRCASCGKWMDVKPGAMNQVTHGICTACLEGELRRLNEGDSGTASG